MTVFDQLDASTIGLAVLAILMPVVGFIMTILYARKGDSRMEQRFRKRHGMLYWVLIPMVTSTVTLLGATRILPRVFAAIGIIILAGTTLLSRSQLQKRGDL